MMDMKYKQLVMILGLAVSTVWYTGCSESNTSVQAESETTTEENEAENKSTEENVIYGQVTEITENGLTIQVGTRKQMEKPEEDSSEKSSEPPEEISMLELTEETQEITITEATTFRKGGMGPVGEATGGQPGEAGEKPGNAAEKPEGGKADGSEAAEQPPEAAAPAQGETITLDDIQEGDEVAITLDEDGNAESIVLLSMEMGGQEPEDMNASSVTDWSEYQKENRAEAQA